MSPINDVMVEGERGQEFYDIGSKALVIKNVTISREG